MSMIINLHDVQLAKTFATRIIGIAKGRVVFDGPPHRLTEKDLARIYNKGEEFNEFKSSASIC